MKKYRYYESPDNMDNFYHSMGKLPPQFRIDKLGRVEIRSKFLAEDPQENEWSNRSGHTRPEIETALGLGFLKEVDWLD
jgi:hypothetical protein